MCHGRRGRLPPAVPPLGSSTQDQSERWDKGLQVCQSPSHLCVFCSPFVLTSHSSRALVFPRAAGQVPWLQQRLCLNALAAVFLLGDGKIPWCLPTQSVGFGRAHPCAETVSHSPSPSLSALKPFWSLAKGESQPGQRHWPAPQASS